MRSLAIKLTLAFLVVSLVGAILVGIIIHRQTNTAFDRFLINRVGTNIAEELAEYYQIHRSWVGIEGRLRRDVYLESQSPGMGFQQPSNYLVASFLLVGPDGRVILGNRTEIGKQILKRELRKAIPIEVDGDVVGLLLPRSVLGLFGGSSPEEIFLVNVNQAILIGALVTVAIALILGGILAYSLTRQLRELTAATERVADGEFGYQVEVRSNDELGELARSFNKMSTDLERSTRVRKQMTADIAHDLRSPLSVILGYTEALNDNKLDGTPEVYDVLYKEAGQLSHLIDDLRTLSLVDAGELSLNVQSISPGELLEDTYRAYKQQAEEKSINLRVKVEPDTPRLKVDPNRMIQVLGNLVSNALRFTPEGGEIVLGAGAVAGDVRLFVNDNGPGITPQDLSNIFNRFYRSDQSRSHNGETGLGLSIAKSLVEAQGGEITVESKPGETIFTMIFPA